MKTKSIFVLILLILPLLASTQEKQTEYERLETYQNEISPFFSSKSASIHLNFIRLRNLVNDDILYGVEAMAFSSKNEIVNKSIAFARLGNVWGSSVGVTVRNINKEGYIFLTQDDLKSVESFINQVIQATGKKQQNYIHYKLSLNEKLEVGMYHDPEEYTDQTPQHKQWKFYVNIDDATYKADYNQGLDLMRKLNHYRKKIRDMNAR